MNETSGFENGKVYVVGEVALGVVLAMMAGIMIVSCSSKGTEPAMEEEVVASESVTQEEEVASECVTQEEVVTSESVTQEEDYSNETGLDPMSPYWYDPNQTEVEFSEDGETLLRFPRIKKGGDYVVPSTVTCIDERAFEMCRELTSVVVPSSVEEIGMAAFDICHKLERVVFQNHLRKIPFRCFSGSENLKELHLSDTIPPVIEKQEDTEEETLFFYFDTKSLTHCTLYVPIGSLQRYRDAYGWRKFKKIVEE